MKTTVRDIMQRDIQTIGPHQSLGQLETALLEYNVSGLPVVEDGRLVGMVSRSDIVRHLHLECDLAREDIGLTDLEMELAPDAQLDVGDIVGHRLQKIRVEDVMNRKISSVSPDTPIRDAARRLVDRHIHRLPVMHHGRLIGMVTSFDVVRLAADGEFDEPG